MVILYIVLGLVVLAFLRSLVPDDGNNGTKCACHTHPANCHYCADKIREEEAI